MRIVIVFPSSICGQDLDIAAHRDISSFLFLLGTSVVNSHKTTDGNDRRANAKIERDPSRLQFINPDAAAYDLYISVRKTTNGVRSCTEMTE